MSMNHSSKPSADTRLIPGGKLLWIYKAGYVSHRDPRLSIVSTTLGSSFARRFGADSILRVTRCGTRSAGVGQQRNKDNKLRWAAPISYRQVKKGSLLFHCVFIVVSQVVNESKQAHVINIAKRMRF